MQSFTSKSYRGVTLIELMTSLAAMSILLMIATPSLQNVAARSEIKTATGNVVQAFRTARNTARMTNSSVKVNLTSTQFGHIITFEFPNKTNTSDDGLTLPQVRLAPKITVAANTKTFTFNPMGMVNTTGTIALFSTINEAQASSVVINNTMGYVTASFKPIGAPAS